MATLVVLLGVVLAVAWLLWLLRDPVRVPAGLGVTDQSEPPVDGPAGTAPSCPTTDAPNRGGEPAPQWQED